MGLERKLHKQKIEPQKIRDVKVLQTFVGGKKVYEREKGID